MSYYALAFYKFVPIEDPTLEVKKHKNFLKERGMKCRVYIGKDGINGQLSGLKQEALDYIAWLKSDPRFADIDVKIHLVNETIFPRISIKEREQIVAMGQTPNYSDQAEHLSPKEWKAMMEGEEKKVLIDVRNDYETAIGHFEGAVLPPLKTFKEFPEYLDKLSATLDKETPIMLCCTGGIRCEAYSPLFKERGFKKVYQLQGGLIRYGLEEGSAHFKGKLFVFDDRLAVPIDGGSNPEPISHCKHCLTPSDLYYNCANCDCNDLFLSCLPCLEQWAGCCSQGCVEAPRVRSYIREGNKPFKRLHETSDEKLKRRSCSLTQPSSK